MTDNYILYEVIGEVVEQVRLALAEKAGVDPEAYVLNYQYGYLEELDETLQQWSKDPNSNTRMFPLVWLKPRFKIVRGGAQSQFFGEVRDMRLFVLHSTTPGLKAKERLEQNYKPVIYPVYREILEQLNQHAAISHEVNRAHAVIDDFYWGDQQQSYLAGPVDCLTIENLNLQINTKTCQPHFKNF